jgi:prevent-host-death family protein
MKTIGTFAAKTHFSRILDEVAAGEAYTITRNGQPVAELRPILAPDRERIDDAIQRLREIRGRAKADPEGFTIRELIENGRRF